MNREIISKELLSLVLGEKVLQIIFSKENNHLPHNYIHVIKARKTTMINLDTFGRLCKEYVNNVSDYMVWSTTNMAKLKDLNNGKYIDKLFSGNTELEAIIKATKWVVEDV